MRLRVLKFKSRASTLSLLLSIFLPLSFSRPLLGSCCSVLTRGWQNLGASMAEKMSTVVMRVDLDCDRCYKKIRKVLCKLQDRANIKTISYDEKSKTVTVSGPFDAEEVSDRLCSDAGKVITDIHVVKGNDKPGAKAPKPGKVNGGGGGGKPEKKHVEFDLDDEAIDQHAHHATKPRVVTTTAVSRLETPRAEPSMSMSAMTPMPMPMPMPTPTPTMVPQATAVPSIWPAAPEWGYSAPAYGGWGGGGPPAGGYYGGPVYDHGGYGPYGYGRNPYPPPPQYYDEEPSGGCSIM